MQFGKIEYLNLLPFHMFMKRRRAGSGDKMSMRYRRGVPSKINRDFAMRRIDAAFISSIAARHRRHSRLGIIAKKEVLSVLVIPGGMAADSASATSNRLAEVLGIHGEVIIGDRALRRHLEGIEAIDLAGVWHERYGLPFVFAVLCHHGHSATIDAITRRFLRAPVKIPRYELERAAKRTGIAPADILRYLEHISYEIDSKAQRGLKKFYRLSGAGRVPKV